MGSVQTQPSNIARWRAARRVYPIYNALALQFGLKMPPCGDLEDADVHSEPDLLDQAEQWFHELDAQLQVHQFRQLLHGTGISVSEEKLHALIERHLGKADKSDADRDKLDFLLVQYFAVCAPPSLQDREIRFEDVAEVLEPVVGDCLLDGVPQWIQPLDNWTVDLRRFNSLGELHESRIVQQGRQLKLAGRELYFTPAALVAFTRFSYLLRRTFYHLINADLKAIDAALDQLEARGCTELDCTPIQLPANSTLHDLRRYCDNFKKPSVPEYSSDTSLTRLIAIRQFLENASASAALPSDPDLRELEERFRRIERELAGLRQFTAVLLAERNKQVITAEPEIAVAAAQMETTPVAPAPVEPVRPAVAPSNVPAPDSTAAAAQAPNLSNTIEEIRRRLTNGSRRGISSIAIGGTALLLTAYEVEAFLRPSDSTANDLQRSLAARALLIHAMEKQKRCGHDVGLAKLLEFCRAEAATIQQHSSTAKDANRHEQSAVLSASATQLSTILRQAEAAVAKSTLVPVNA